MKVNSAFSGTSNKKKRAEKSYIHIKEDRLTVQIV